MSSLPVKLLIFVSWSLFFCLVIFGVSMELIIWAYLDLLRGYVDGFSGLGLFAGIVLWVPITIFIVIDVVRDHKEFVDQDQQSGTKDD